MQLEITTEEKRFLNDALDHYLIELSGEISSTDQAEFREDLKREKEVLTMLRKRFETE